MSDFPAKNRWTLYSVQKTLPIIGRVGALFGAHNYLALVNPDGNIDREMHGIYTGPHFIALGPEPGNYLNVKMFQRNGYMEEQSIIAAKPILSGDERHLRALLHTGYKAVAEALDSTRMLYDGVEIFGHSVNSNSVWYTALRAMGVQNPAEFDGWGGTPGNGIDLRTEPSNNKWIGEPEDAWAPNPAFTSIYPDARAQPPTSEMLSPEPEAFEPDAIAFDWAIEEERERFRRQYAEVMALIGAIDADSLSADRDVIDGLLDDLNAQLGNLNTLSGSGLLDRLSDLANKLYEWRDYLAAQSEPDDRPDGWQEEDRAWEEGEGSPLPYDEEDAPIPDPVYVEPDPQPAGAGEDPD